MVLPRNPAALLLTPGASADREHATLVAIDEALPELTVERLTLGTTSVNRAVAKIEDAVRALAEQLAVGVDQIVIGGRSFGGRACSVAAAEGLGVGGLLLLSYPLHPPGKPEKLRVEHFPAITMPALFISGERDPFGSPEEFEHHVSSIPGPVALEWVAVNHSPKGAAEQAVVEMVRGSLIG